MIRANWLRRSRAAPSDFCAAARIGFTATFEDRFTWRAIVTGADGRVTDANAQTIGGFRACFGPRADGSGTDMYVDGDLDGVAFRGNGVCHTDANSRNVIGGISDPPGYTQASIATIRLWKR